MPKTNLRLTRMFCVNLSSIDSVVLLKFEKKRLFSCALTDKKNGQTERQTDKLKKSCPRHSRTNIDVVCKFQLNRLSSFGVYSGQTHKHTTYPKEEVYKKYRFSTLQYWINWFYDIVPPDLVPPRVHVPLPQPLAPNPNPSGKVSRMHDVVIPINYRDGMQGSPTGSSHLCIDFFSNLQGICPLSWTLYPSNFEEISEWHFEF